MCVGLYFLISPDFSNPANSGTQGEETGGQEENQSNIIILDYKVFNASGEEIEFNSSITILDENNITKNQIINDYKFLTIPLFATGEIEITLTSNVSNATVTFKIIVE